MNFGSLLFGKANLGITIDLNNKQILNFSTGKLVVTENKHNRNKYFYNLLVGTTEFPELAEEISQKHLKYDL